MQMDKDPCLSIYMDISNHHNGKTSTTGSLNDRTFISAASSTYGTTINPVPTDLKLPFSTTKL